MTGPITVKEVMKQFRSRRLMALAYVNIANEFQGYKSKVHEYSLLIDEYESVTGIYRKDLKDWRDKE